MAQITTQTQNDLPHPKATKVDAGRPSSAVNGHYVNGDIPKEANSERAQIINDEKQFTYVTSASC